jgi:Crp-like helix-turn-helix domain
LSGSEAGFRLKVVGYQRLSGRVGIASWRSDVGGKGDNVDGCRVSFNRCIVQLEAHTVRCPIELLQNEFRNSEHVRDLFVSYSETLLSQVQQTVACNSMHTMEERICRWLLMMHDRAEGKALPYTHEFLSHILGANRKSVTLAAQLMRTAGLISYRRGTIQVLDRAGLEKASCECYAIVKERFGAFLTAIARGVRQ